MPTMAELGKLTSQLYKGNPSVGAYETKSGLQWDQDAATSLGFISSGFWLWSGEESSSSSADYRIFSPAYSGWNSGRNGNSYGQAVCIVD